MKIKKYLENIQSAKKTFEKINAKDLLLGSAIGDLQSIGTGNTGGERLQKMSGLIAKAIAASSGGGG